jgi:hypothetical protein
VSNDAADSMFTHLAKLHNYSYEQHLLSWTDLGG